MAWMLAKLVTCKNCWPCCAWLYNK